MEKINTVKWQLLMCALLLIICLLVISLVVILVAGTTGKNISLPVSITLIFVGLMVLAIVLAVYLVHKWIKRKSMDLTTANTNDNVSHISEPNKEVKDDNFMSEGDEDKVGVRGVEVTPNPPQRTVACGNLEWQILVCALFVFFCLLTTSVVVIVLDHYLGTDIALPVSISLILVGVMVLPIAFIVYCVLKCTRHNKYPKKTNIHTYAYVCDHKEASIETELGHSTFQGSEVDEIAATRVETTADLNRGYESTTPDMVDEYDCELPELNEERTCDNPQESTDAKMTDMYDNVYDPAIIEPTREEVYDYSRSSGVGSGEGDSEIAGRRVGATFDSILEPGYGTVTCKPTTPDMVDEYDCEQPQLNEERTCDYLRVSTDTNIMKDIYDNVYDPAVIEPNIDVDCDYLTGVVSGEDQIATNPSSGIETCRSTTPDMVDIYDCELPELNEERTCDNPPQSADSKMTDTYDNVYDPAIVDPSREVEYNYSTGVGSGEDEIAPRRVEMTVNPSYETGICKSTTPDMVDEYDCQLPELNEERTCDNPPQSTDPKMIDIYDNVYDPAIIEPTREVVHDYSRSSGVGSEFEEDKVAATPSCGIATCKSTTPDMVDEYDYEFPELNEEWTWDTTSQSTVPELIDTYDNVYDSAIIEPNIEVACGYPTDVGSGEHEVEATKVEFAILEDWILK